MCSWTRVTVKRFRVKRNHHPCPGRLHTHRYVDKPGHSKPNLFDPSHWSRGIYGENFPGIAFSAGILKASGTTRYFVNIQAGSSSF